MILNVDLKYGAPTVQGESTLEEPIIVMGCRSPLRPYWVPQEIDPDLLQKHVNVTRNYTKTVPGVAIRVDF